VILLWLVLVERKSDVMTVARLDVDFCDRTRARVMDVRLPSLVELEQDARCAGD
jgi:hypothetical protein